MEKSMSQGGYPAYPAPKDPRIQVNTSAELNAIPVESRYPKMEVKNLNTDLGTPITSYHELDVAVDADEATKADNNNWRTFFREYDKDHSGMNNRDAAASHPAEAVSYNPAVPGDWNIVGGTPEEVKNGLDRLASSLASVSQATRVTIAPNVYFVDRAKGDDADAVLNNPSKPFETIAAASLAASLESDPTGVYVYAGLYNDVDMMQPGIPMYCDSGVIVYSNQLGNSIVNDSNGAGEYTLLGNARIYSVDIAGSVIFTEGGSIGNIELDEVDTLDFDTSSSTSIIFTLNIKRIKFNLHVGRLARIITNNTRLLSGFWTKPAGLYTKASVHFKECLFEFPSPAEYTALLTTEDDEGNVLLIHNANRGITQDATLSSINASIIAAGTVQTSAIQLVGTDATFGDLQTIFDDCVVAIKREHGLGIRLVQTQEGLNGSSRINNAYITSNGLTSASDFSFIATDEAFGRLIPAKVTSTASDTPSSAVLPSGYEWLPNKEKSADLPSEHVRIVTDALFTDIDGEELVIYDRVGTHTIKLPANPYDGQKIDISEIQGSELLIRIADGASYTIAGANEIKLIKSSSQLKYIKKTNKFIQVGSSSGSGDGVSQLDYHWTATSDGQIDFVIAGASEDEISDILSVHINGSRINPQNATVRTTVISRDTLRVEFADEDDGLILEGDDVLLSYGAVVGAPDNSKAALIKDDGDGNKALFDDGTYKEIEINSDFTVDSYLFKQADIAIVDGDVGDDGTASVGGLEYETIGAAAVAAKAVYDSNNQKKVLVYVKSINSTYELAANGADIYPYIHYFFENKAIVRGAVGAGNNIGDQTNGRGKYWIHGKGEFYTADGQFNISYWQAGSDVFWDAHLIHHISTPQGTSTGGYPRTNLVCNADYVLAAGNWQGDAGDVGGVMMEFNYTEFLGGIATSTYYNDEWTIKYNRCKFRLSPAIFEPNGAYQYDVVYSDGSAAFSLDMSTNGHARQSRLKDFTSVVTSSQVAIDAVESLNDKVAAAEIFISGSSSGSGRNVNLIFDTCQFIIDQDKAIGLKIAQLTNTTVEDSSIQVLNPVFIDESGGGTDTVAYTAYKGIAVTQDVKLLITNPKSSTDTYKGSHSTPASYPDIELVTLINDSVVDLTIPDRWFVDGSNGNDTTGDGTAQNPWRTIQKGINEAVTGDVIVIAKATYSGSLNTTKSITLQGDGDSVLQDTAEMPKIVGNLTATSTSPVVITLIGIQVTTFSATIENTSTGVLVLYISNSIVAPSDGITCSDLDMNISKLLVEYNNDNLRVDGGCKITNSDVICTFGSPVGFVGDLGSFGGSFEFINTSLRNVNVITDQAATIKFTNSYCDGDITTDTGDITQFNSVLSGSITTNGSVIVDNQPDSPHLGAWYVSLGGNDANDGSPQSPFRTIGKAITDSSAGDTIHIQVGAYNETITIDKHLILIGSQFANQGSSSPETTVGITSLTIGANGSGASITGIFANGGLVVTEPSGVTICSINQCFFSGLSTITATTGFLLIDIKDTIFANQLILGGNNVYLDAYDLNIVGNLTIANCDSINLYNCIAKAQVVLTGSATVNMYDGYVEQLNSFSSPATLTIHGTSIYTDNHSGSGTGTLTQKVPWSSGGTTWTDYRYIDPDNGQDNTDAGSPQSPYASLAYAEGQAGTDDTFVLMNGSATGGTFDRSFKLIALNGNFLTTTITIDCNVAARTVEFEGVNFTNTTIAKFGANNLTIIFKNCHGTLTDLTADDLEFYNCTLEKLTSVKTYDTAIINASKITLTGTITIGTSFTLSNSYLIANLSGTATLTLHNSEQDGTIAGTITVDSGEAKPLYSDIVAVTTNTTVNFDENVGALVEVSSSAICTVGLRGTPNSDNLTIGDYMDVIDRGTAEVGINTSTSSGGAINGTRPSLGLPKKPNVKNRIYRYVYLGSDTFIVSDVEEATIQVTLTQAQIQALSTTPITVIAAPGTNKIIELISCIAVNNYNTAAFATATLIRLKDATLGNVRMNSSSSFVQATAKRVEQMDHASAVEIGVNEALVVEADADATAGNAASTIELNVKYRVVDV